MKDIIKNDDSIRVKKSYWFNYYKRLKKIKVAQKGVDLRLHLNRSRAISFMPDVLDMKIPVCIYGIYTNGCLFDYADLSKDDIFKLNHFYPEIERVIISYKELKKLKAPKKKTSAGKKKTKAKKNDK